MEILIMNVPPAATYEGQLAQRVAELLPDADEAERLELLGAMDEGDLRTSMAFILTLYPQVFDHSLVRDRKLVERLQDRLDHQYDDEPEPYCSACGASIGIFIGHGDAWLHYTGEGTVESPVDLYDAGHAPVIAWREAGGALDGAVAEWTGHGPGCGCDDCEGMRRDAGAGQ
jgi:hypothetical protein